MELSGLLVLGIVGVIAAAVDVAIYRRAAHRDAPVASWHWAVARRDRTTLSGAFGWRQEVERDALK